ERRPNQMIRSTRARCRLRSGASRSTTTSMRFSAESESFMTSASWPSREGCEPDSQGVQEADQPGKVVRRVVELRKVTADRAVQVGPLGQLLRHPTHVRRIHRVVRGADDKRRYVDVLEVARAVPVFEGAAEAELARPLHGHVDRR